MESSTLLAAGSTKLQLLTRDEGKSPRRYLRMLLFSRLQYVLNVCGVRHLGSSKNVVLKPALHKHRIFLLSPANLSGIRAGYVFKESAESEIACRLRRNGVLLGELFTYISSLYFRGKLAYARAFCAPPAEVLGSYVITASAGLLGPETLVTMDQLREMAMGNVDAGDQRYRSSLERDCLLLSEQIKDPCDIVLLGSIATPKYVEPLLQIFGERLLFPTQFVGRGDMSRGGLMLRAVEAVKELEYAPVLNAVRHGSKPPKLLPTNAARRNEKNLSQTLL